MQINKLINKTASLKKFTQISLLIFLILLINPLHAEYLEVNSTDVAKFRTFDSSSKKYIETGNALNFSQGVWIKVQKVNSNSFHVEFHSKNSGMIIFSKLDNSKMLYLEAPKRVLIYKILNHPYVDTSSVVKYGGIEKVKKMEKQKDGSFVSKDGIQFTIIYDSDKNEIDSFKKIMNENREKILTSYGWKDYTKYWKTVPYFQFQNGIEVKSSYPNYFGELLKKSNDFKDWAISKSIFQPGTLTFDKLYKNDARPYMGVLRKILEKLMRGIIHGNNEKIFRVRLDSEEAMFNMKISDFLNSESLEFIKHFGRDGDDSVIASLNKIMDNLMLIATKILEIYFFDGEYRFFKDYLQQQHHSITMQKLTQIRKQQFERIPPFERVLNSGRAAMTAGDLYQKNEDNYSGMFKNEISEITSDFKNIINLGFDKLVENLKWVDQENNNDNLLEILGNTRDESESKLIFQTIQSKQTIKCAYKESDYEKTKQSLLNLNFADLAYEILVVNILPKFIPMYEVEIMNQIETFDPIKEMNLKMSFGDDKEKPFQAFKMGMAMIGKANFECWEYSDLGNEGLNIFAWHMGNMRLI